ncbi:phenylalanine--tRNA ligase subunit alpha [Candidatus Woesearchaeota archaeon]|nr:phenylalanine--tRNA ligase subunit alpha [Candidatus Woesearchaeota archaeon]
MDFKKLAQSLHQYERRVLPELEKHALVSELVSVTGLKEIEVNRALQWLESKSAVEVLTEPRELILLGKNGEKYAKDKLPERVFLEALSDKPFPLDKLSAKTGLSNEEVNVCVGGLRSKSAIVLLKDKGLQVKITEQGLRMRDSELLEESFLKNSFPLAFQSLSPQDKGAFESLRKRRDIIRIEVEKVKRAKLTDVGKKLVSMGVRDEDMIDSLTPQMLSTGAWQQKSFRRYDVSAHVPNVFGGKKQPYRAFLDWVRFKFASLGFQEMSGPLVETDFWNMDALYMPQFHSARDIHDAYYVKEPKVGKLDPALVKRVKEMHESGGQTGSKGWQYDFDVERTHRLLLRTQGTACSSRMLASKDLKIPGKYFGISRAFRHDVIDATHLPDFNQIEGIVVEEGLTFRHLIGLLKMFAKEFAGTEEIKLVPGYFPFTEPSVELYAKHPQLGWIELGGAGIFRPEVVTPLLGKNVSVCAWGLGIDRLGMFKLGIKDIRNLFSQDVAFLRDGEVM